MIYMCYAPSMALRLCIKNKNFHIDKFLVSLKLKLVSNYIAIDHAERRVLLLTFPVWQYRAYLY